MGNYTLDTTQLDANILLAAATDKNAETVGNALTSDEYDLGVMEDTVIEPVTEKVYVLKNGESVGTVYNSEYAVAKALDISDDTVFSHVLKRIETVVSFEEVFDSWHRYVHSWSVDTQPTWPSAVDSWTYDPDLNSIISGTDTQTRMHHIGMVSPNSVRNYDLDIGLSLYRESSANDIDDWLGVVVGFITDADGIERTITAIRSTGATSQALTDDRSKWYVNSAGTIGSGSTPATQIALVYDFRGTDQRILFSSHDEFIGHVWFSSGGSRIRAVKNGSMLSVDWYDMTGNTNDDIVASFTIDLDDADDTRQFKDFVQIGYCAQSQAYGVFTNLVDGGNYVFSTSAYGELVDHDGGTVQYGYEADVENEGVDTSGALINTEPAREVKVEIINKAYTPDTVTIRYDRVQLTDIMVMDNDIGDFDWYDSASWDNITSATGAVDGFKAAAVRQGLDPSLILYNVTAQRVTVADEYYLSVGFGSYLLKGDDDTDYSLFKLPVQFFDMVTTTTLGGFVYTPIEEPVAAS